MVLLSHTIITLDTISYKYRLELSVIYLIIIIFLVPIEVELVQFCNICQGWYNIESILSRHRDKIVYFRE